MAMFVVRLPRMTQADLFRKLTKKMTPAAIARAVEPILTKSLTDRFDKYSNGGGDWKKLKPATIARKGSDRILFDTGDFRKALGQGLRARVSWVGKQLRVEATLKTNRRHKPSRLPMQKLLTIHHLGTKTIPARKVIVRPRPDTIQKAHKAILALARNRR